MEDVVKSDKNKLNALVQFITRKKLLIALIIIAVGASGWYFTAKSQKSAAAGFLTNTVARGTVTNTISASGTVEPVTTVSLTFQNAEIIKGIYVTVGDKVVPNQLLAELYTDNLDASLIQASANLKGNTAKLALLQKGATVEDLDKAEADVQMAQASYDLAKFKLEQYEQLYQGGAVSQSDFDNINLEYVNAEGKLRQSENSLKTLRAGSDIEDIEAAEANVDSSNAQLRMAQNDLSGAKMYSPIEGTVSSVNGAVGQRSTANNNNTSGSGNGFIDIISEKLQLTAQINEGDIGKIAVGQKVEFTVNAYSNKTFNGTLLNVAPQAYTSSNVQIYDVIIQLDRNYQELRAGMPADVTVIIEQSENVLTIPKGAVSYATNYLNKMRQEGTPVVVGNSGGANGGQSQSRPRAGESTGSTGAEGAGPGSGNDGAGQEGTGEDDSNGNGADGTNQRMTISADSTEQPTLIFVMDSYGNPAPQMVVLGISDSSSYEVIRGLNEGDIVVTGSSADGTTTTTTQQSSQGNRSGGGPAGGGMMMIR